MTGVLFRLVTPVNSLKYMHFRLYTNTEWLTGHLTSDGESTVGISKFISNIAGVISNDIFNFIIHYKCILVGGVPSRYHCLIKFVLPSISLKGVTISQPGDVGSRRIGGGAVEGEIGG